MGAGGSEDQGHLGLPTKVKARLGQMRPCHTKEKTYRRKEYGRGKARKKGVGEEERGEQEREDRRGRKGREKRTTCYSNSTVEESTAFGCGPPPPLESVLGSIVTGPACFVIPSLALRPRSWSTE